MQEYWLKNEKLFAKHDAPQHRKTETRHGNAPQILFGAWTTTPKSLKEAGFVFLLHKLVFIVSRVDWCARIRLNVRISLLEKDPATGSTLLSAWGATSNQWTIKMPRLRLVADVINQYEELIQSQPVRSINANYIGNRFCNIWFCGKIYCWARTGV